MTTNPTILNLKTGAFSDFFKDWPNDDLLITEEYRTQLHDKAPHLAHIFDWKDLRDAFIDHDNAAAAKRKDIRKWGAFAVLLGFLSLALAALSPMLDQMYTLTFVKASVEAVMGIASAVLAVASAGVAGWHMFNPRTREEWMSHRLCAERLRQLHFQFILNHLEDATASLTDATARTKYEAARKRCLDRILDDHRKNPTTRIDELSDDLAEQKTWLEKAWETPAPVPAGCEEIVNLLAEKRIGVQKRYADLKLLKGRTNFLSPATQSRMIAVTSNILTLAIVILTVVTGWLFFAHPGAKTLLQTGTLTATALCTAVIVSLRVLNDGLQITTDTERYEWYSASVRALEARFDEATRPRPPLDAVRVQLLRQTEELAYREMRRFVVSLKRMKFLM